MTLSLKGCKTVTNPTFGGFLEVTDFSSPKMEILGEDLKKNFRGGEAVWWVLGWHNFSVTIKWSESGTPYVTAFSPWLAKVWIVATDKNAVVLSGVFLLFNRRNRGKSSIDSVPTKASCIQNFYTWVYLNLKIRSLTFLTVKKKWLAKIPCTEREHISHQRGSSEHHL